MAYIQPEEVLAVLGGPAQSKPSANTMESFIAEAESLVRGTLGSLSESPRDEEAAGIIRDLAASRALYLMRAAQSPEPPRVATSLASDARNRLRELDERTNLTGGTGEVDPDAFENVQEAELFTLADQNLRWVETGGVYPDTY